MARKHRRSGTTSSDPRSLFLNRLSAIFDVSKGEAEDIASTPLTQSFRINPLSPRPIDTIRADLEGLGVDFEPVGWCEHAFHLHSDKRILAESELFKSGDVYIQNASSFAPSVALDPQPGDDILDLCAAPGGKSIHIAALSNNTARLWVNDGIETRIPKLEEVTSTFHAKIHQMTCHPAQYADKFIDQQFDKILIDAQCSGEGMINLADPNPMRYWSMERITKYSRLQQRMIMSAWKLLKPGGTLVYSTCTYAPEENELPLNHLLKHRDEADIVPIDAPIPGAVAARTNWDGERLDERLTGTRRIRASQFYEGFFVGRVVKRG